VRGATRLDDYAIYAAPLTIRGYECLPAIFGPYGLIAAANAPPACAPSSGPAKLKGGFSGGEICPDQPESSTLPVLGNYASGV
jgi:hypothetical protein